MIIAEVLGDFGLGSLESLANGFQSLGPERCFINELSGLCRAVSGHHGTTLRGQPCDGCVMEAHGPADGPAAFAGSDGRLLVQVVQPIEDIVAQTDRRNCLFASPWNRPRGAEFIRYRK
jgi:hypothetical protein